MNKISNSEQYVSSKVYLAGDIVVKVGNKVYKANCWTKKIQIHLKNMALELHGVFWKTKRAQVCLINIETSVYQKGDLINIDGAIYMAKWYTKGEDPKTKSGSYDVWQKFQSIKNGAEIPITTTPFNEAKSDGYSAGDIISYTNPQGSTIYYQASVNIKKDSETNKIVNPYIINSRQGGRQDEDNPCAIN